MDRKPDFKHHMKTMAEIAMRPFRAISRLVNIEKGLSLQSLRQLYLGFVTTIGDY